MIVDSSALMAIILDEPERALFTDLLLTTDRKRLSAGTWIELAAVLTRCDPGGSELFAILEAIVARFGIELSETTVKQAQIGHAAYRQYGRGIDPRARLNFGDCFSYALAIEADEPLLFKGDDFVHTAVSRAA